MITSRIFTLVTFFGIVLSPARLVAQDIEVSTVFELNGAPQAYATTLMSELNSSGYSAAIDPNGRFADVASAYEGVLARPGRLAMVPLNFFLVREQTATTAMLYAPSLFNDLGHARATQQGPIGDRARSDIVSDRAKILRLWPYATEALVANVALDSTELFARLSAAEGVAMNDQFFRSLGAGVKNLEGRSLATAKDIDIAAVPPWAIPQLYEQGTQIQTVVTNHRVFPAAVIVGSDWWEGLGAGQQRGILTALDISEQAAAAVLAEDEDELAEWLRERGIIAQTWRNLSSEASDAALVSSVLAVSDAQPEDIERQLNFVAEPLEKGSVELPRHNNPGIHNSPSRVLFATDRRFDSQFSNVADRFGNVEDPMERTHCGELVPASRASVGIVEEEIALVQGTTISEGDECIKRVIDVLNESQDRLTVLIHGYANDFEDSSKRALSFARDARLAGPVLLWSWPSRGAERSYKDDVDAIGWSQAQFTDLIGAVSMSQDFDGIDILAHSMGTRLATNFMRDAWPEMAGVVVLAAADLGRPLLKQAVRRTPKAHTIVLISDRDRALWLSGAMMSEPRVGTLPPIFYHPNVDTIDLSAFDTGPMNFWPPGLNFNHSHAFDALPVVNDLARVFAGEWQTASRGLDTREIDGSGGQYFAIIPGQ